MDGKQYELPNSSKAHGYNPRNPHRDDPALPELRRLGEPVVVLDVNPTAETIARLIFDHAASQGLPVTEVTLWETETSFATYRPSGEV